MEKINISCVSWLTLQNRVVFLVKMHCDISVFIGGLALPPMFNLSPVICLGYPKEEYDESTMLVNGLINEPMISFGHENI